MADRMILDSTKEFNRLRNDILNQEQIFVNTDVNIDGNSCGENSQHTDIPIAANTDVELVNPSDYFASNDAHWEMNYHEAAIYLEEGENNEKFDSHPHEPKELPAYLLVHNKWYYSLDLITSVTLLALALSEDPAVPGFELSVACHCLIELAALGVIAAELALKLRWIGWWTILKHKRTMIKGIALVVMFFEALVVLFRQSAHFRATRALRPIFLVDTHELSGVRRFIRQILQSLPPILDMFALILFFVCVYSIFGFFLFSSDPDDVHFATMYDSFVSVFVLLTTANFPDIMMPSYARSRWYSLFFISYLCIVLYILMNLVLAVVFETFTTIEMEKVKKLYLHKQEACQRAYKLLVTKRMPNQLRFQQFRGLMKYFAPKKSERDVVITFKYLNESNSGTLSMDEFYKIYDSVMLKWKARYSDIPWYHSVNTPRYIQNVCQMAYNVAITPYFEYFFYSVTVLNAIAMLRRVLYSFDKHNLEKSAYKFSADWDTIMFSSLFIVEISVKIIGLGWRKFVSSGWNVYDFVVAYLTLYAAIVLRFQPHMYHVVVFRPLKTFKLFKLKKRFRDIIGTVALLSPLMRSALAVALILYYFFAIIGMELFADYDMRDCCKGSKVEDFYQYKSTNESSAVGYYYLNTFSNLAVSYVTLFELTVVNNWVIVMNGYSIVAHPLARIYFIAFYLFTMVVLTIIVASILDAFRFRIQYKKQTTKTDEEKMLREEVDLKWEELTSWVRDFQLLEKLRPELIVGGVATFIGCRPRSRQVLQRRMYSAEIERWLKEGQAHATTV